MSAGLFNFGLQAFFCAFLTILREINTLPGGGRLWYPQ